MLQASYRKKAVRLFESGLGYKACARELGLNKNTVREWHSTWRAIGTEAFLGLSEQVRHTYTKEVQQAAVEDYKAGESVVSIMKKYKIISRKRIAIWVKKHSSHKDV